MLFQLKLREHDFEIGEADAPYLLRWHLVPRNRWFSNIYLHRILRSDDDRALHDHPWWNISIVLRGGYWEYKPFIIMGRKTVLPIWRGAGAIVFRRPAAAHRLEIDPSVGPTWTLFITGPKVREWGFLCPKGWRHHDEFAAAGSPGQIGQGCGE